MSIITVAFLQNAAIEYLSDSMCVCVCVCLCVFLHDNSKSNRSKNMKFEYFVEYENIMDKFDNGHCRIKVKVTMYNK